MSYFSLLKSFFAFVFFSATQAWASPAQPETIQKYLEVTQSEKAYPQLYENRKAYYLDLAIQRVLYHIHAPKPDAALLTPQQYQAAEKIAALYLKNDPIFSSAEQFHQFTTKQLQHYYSDESLLYFIEQYQTEAGQRLVEKNRLTEIYLASLLPQLLINYLDKREFMHKIFKDILTYKNPPSVAGE